jgi:hypothetical protein
MFQENGYITESDLCRRILRLQIRYAIVISIMRHKGETLVLRRHGNWSYFGTESSDMFIQHFKIYTGNRDRFNWTNNMLVEACKTIAFPFLRTEYEKLA